MSAEAMSLSAMPLGAMMVFVLVGTFTPGPNNIMAMECARRRGFWGSRFFILGMGSGFFLVMLSCALFNIALAKVMPEVRPVLGAFGAVYMLWLAAKPFLRSKKKEFSDPGGGHPYITGLLLQFLNPKVILYGIATMAGFVLPYTDAPAMLALFSLGFALVGLAATGSWALFGAVFQRYFSKHEFAINVAMAILLVWCATAISGVDFGTILKR